MAPSRAPPTLPSLARALTRPRPLPRTGKLLPPPSRLTFFRTVTAPSIPYRSPPPPRTLLSALPHPAPSAVAVVVQSRFTSRYSTAPVNPPSAADSGNATNESKAVDDDGAAGPEPPDYLSAGERAVFEKVKRELAPSRLEVQDISGGCGSMYAIEVVSIRFRGLSVVRQHRLVNEVLREEIRGWHGVQLKTRAG